MGTTGYGGTVNITATTGVNLGNITTAGGSLTLSITGHSGAGGSAAIAGSPGLNGGNGGAIGSGPSANYGGNVSITTTTGILGTDAFTQMITDGGSNNTFAGTVEPAAMPPAQVRAAIPA